MDTVRATDYHDIAHLESPRISPAGDEVAFVRKTAADDQEYEATIYVVPIGGDEPTQFTVAEGVDAEPRWSPSGDRLAFVSTRGADDDRPQLWVMPTDGGEARQVTEVAGGVSGITWSPDGDQIAFTQQVTADDREEDRDLSVDPEYEPETPDPRVIDRTIYRAHERYFDGRRSQVYVVDIGDDEITRITDGDRDHVGVDFGDSTTLYYARKIDVADPDDTIVHEIVAYDCDAASETVLTEAASWLPTLAATADGRVAFSRTPEEKATLQQPDLVVYDSTDGSKRVLTQGLDRSPAQLPPQWGPNREQLFFAINDEGAVDLYRVADDADASPEFVRGNAATINGFAVGEDTIAFVQSDWDHPGDLFASTLGGAEEVRLTRVNDEYLEGRAVAEPEELWFESDGHEIQGWLLTPPDFDPEEEYPLAVEIHGGPHAMWTTSGTMWHEFQTLAASGYVVFWSNPRGSTGYGESFMAAIERDWGAVTLDDVLAGVDTVCDREYVDEDNQFVTGGSFGGYMTAWAVGQTDRFRGAVSQRGVYDLDTFYGTSDAYKLAEWDFDALPWEQPEVYREHSPLTYAHEVDTPTLLIHSEDDFRTPMPMAEQYHRVLSKVGVDTRLVRYPREGHELSRSGEPGHVVDRIERIVRWFDGYSDHHTAERALDRPRDDGLSAGEESKEEDETS